MEQQGQGRSLAERLAALSPERRALLELALKGQAPAPRAARARPPLSAVFPEGTEDFRSLAPLPEVSASFSWVQAAQGAGTEEQARLLADAHRDLRGALFRAVDLTTCERVLGFGGDDGREWVSLARRPGTFRVIGHASSPQEAEAARARVRAHSLEGRIQVVSGGLDADGLETGFDVAFGWEVLRHPDERAPLFAALGRKVREGGRLVLGDVFLKTALSLPHVEPLALPLLDELVGWLTSNGFLATDCVDAASEMGNFLHEPALDARLSQLGWGAEDVRAEAARSHEVLGGLLRGGAAAYVLLTAEKRGELAPERLEAMNREQLMRTRRYADLPHAWLYAPRWRRVASALPAESERDTAHCLVFSDRGGLGAALARSMSGTGARCTFVHRGEVFRRHDDGSYEVPIRNPEDFLRLTEALASEGTVPSRVVYLWSLDGPKPEGLTVSQLQDETLDVCGGLLYLTQALLKAGASHPASPSLWLVTRGAQRADDAGGVPGLAGASLWGLGKAIAYEHPELDCRRVDVDPGRDVEESARALWTELRSRDGEDQVLLHEGARRVLRLARHRQWDWEGAGRLQFRADATYLVTGGLGGLGLQVARWMVRRGARNLVLLGRKRASDVSTEEVREMRAQGAAIISLAGVSVDSDLDFVMAGISKRMPPLRGIVHAMTEVDDGILLHQTRERLGRVFTAKVAGAWNLHRWLEGTPLDFFHMVSSSTSLMGGSGQASHLSATSFLDGLAEYRRSLGLPGQSSSWGAWAQPGDEASEALDARMRKRGVGMVPAAEAFSVLEQVFGPVPASVGVMPIHWPTFLGGLPGDGPPPLFADFGGDARPARAELRRELLRRVRGGSVEEGRGAVLEWFREQVAKVLELNASQWPEPEQTLHELGLDSLMGVELKKLLHAQLRVEFPLQELLGGKSIGELSGSLYEALR
ncbi:polyketide synthase [Myxococcus stipitatus DSM 14675]|uniref:Polyketide synthase n=1 Tax=Myxococcus stipitatus (strain DSM 14675 / JCM 12634 / Mx s8) TaxID=1278073 RepID=L7UHB2_MYXSD|nr:KR domain-containing protein [Myxococcus stipitatus]AGC47280.1 polyketide synthase [Myxococcus stipitatus DSM 14675]